MPAVAISSASSRHRYGTETIFGTAVVPVRKFGTDTEADFDLAPSNIKLRQSGSRTLEGYTPGTDMATISTRFGMTSPWFWPFILGKVTKTAATASTPTLYKFEKQNTPKSFTHEMRVKGSDAGDTSNSEKLLKGEDVKYTCAGCVVESADISCSADQVAQVTLNATSGNVTLANTAFAEFANDTNPDTYTYTFRHGTVTIKEGSDDTPAEVLQVKEITARISTGQTQEKAFGHKNAQSSLGGELNYSGNIRCIMINQEKLKYVLNRKVLSELVVSWTNGESAADLRSITLRFSNVLLEKHKVSSGKVNRLDDMLDFTATDLVVEARSGSTSQLT